jgi:hypothetical protein
MRRNECWYAKMRRGKCESPTVHIYSVWSCGLLVRVRESERDVYDGWCLCETKLWKCTGDLATAGDRRASLDHKMGSGMGAARGWGLLRDPPDGRDIAVGGFVRGEQLGWGRRVVVGLCKQSKVCGGETGQLGTLLARLCP